MHYMKNPKCICETVEDGIILLNEDSGDTIVLNETASFLYEHCHLDSIEEIVQALFSVLDEVENAQSIELECRECIKHMVNSGALLEVEDA